MGEGDKIEQNRTALAKKAMLEALRKTLGIVTPALEKANVSRTNFYLWLKTDPDFKMDVDDVQEIALDFAESRLLKRIKDGSDASTIFYMKTKGKKRGYIERNEFTGKDGNPLVPAGAFVSMDNLTPEQTAEIVNKQLARDSNE